MKEKILNLIAQALGIETTDIQDSSKLREDLGLADADLLEIISKINEDYNIQVPEDQLGEIKTVEELVELIENYVQEKI